MHVRKYRWSKVYESSEEELIRHLAVKQIDAERWVAEEGETFPAHAHPLDKRLWCAEGSIHFTIDNKNLSLQSGDTLDIPAGTVHEARAGLGGCVCYESPRQSQNQALPV